MPWPRIIYEDIAPGAVEATTATAADKQSWSLPGAIFSEVVPVKVATLEHNLWTLDGSFQFFPDTPDPLDHGWWTASMCDADGAFQTKPVLVLTLNGNYTSVGLGFTFDTIENTWPTWMQVRWYRGTELLAEENFAPDAAKYSAIKTVKRFSRLEITFDRMSRGYRYLKMEKAVYGITRLFEKDEVSDIALYDGVSLISDEIEAGDATFSVRNLSDIPFNFLRKQTLYIYHGDNLLCTRFISKSTQIGARNYKITAKSYLSLLAEGEDHYGGMYTGELSENVLADIIGDIVPYTIDASLKGIPIRGWLPKDSRLNNLAKVLFVIGGCVSDFRGTELKIFKPVLPGAGTPENISSRNRVNPQLGTDKVMTAVEVTEHSFTAGTEVTELFNAALTGSTTLTFSEPMTNLVITGGTLVGSGANYAVISGTGGVVKLTGCRYKHTSRIITKVNDLVETNTFPNVKKCKENYLVTPENSQAVLERYFAFHQRNRYITTTIRVEGDSVGDLVRVENSWLGEQVGNIVSVDMTLSKKLVADVRITLAAEDE